VSRVHLLAGIMSYVTSPLWLLFVVSALALGVQYEFARQQYFTHAPSLFPLWPRIDPARAVRLFALTIGVLFGPKALGWLSIVASARRLREYGGLVRFTLGVLLEGVVAAFLAPIRALIHCGLVSDVLSGRDSGWHGQRREGASVPWRLALRRHRWHAVTGVALAVVGYEISWQMLAWLTPAVAGMVLSAPLAKLVASVPVGRRLRRMGLLWTPEETRVPAISRAAEAAVPVYRDALSQAPRLADVIADAELLKQHLALTDRELPRPRGSLEVLEAVAERKIRLAHTVDEAIAALTPTERGRVQARRSLLMLLAALSPLAAAAGSGSWRRSFGDASHHGPASQAPDAR
jgi:membrane glycosyltransferase